MSAALSYDKVLKYKIQAVLQEPLHVGSAGGDPEEILVHPTDGQPFIQASGIAGAFREAYVNYCKDRAEALFGSAADGSSSRIVFSDGLLFDAEREHTGLTNDNLKNSGTVSKKVYAAATELRPRVKINRATGSVDSERVNGTQNESGAKFNMKYVAAGTKLEFTTYIFSSNEYPEDDSDYRFILGVLQGNGMQFGGQKSDGCGYVQLDKVLFRLFDLQKETDRKDWLREEVLPAKTYVDITSRIEKTVTDTNAYTILVEARTEGFLLVKALAVPEVGKDAPDEQNMQNARKEYIIPGSSMKGAIRERMTQIAEFLASQNKSIDGHKLIENAFGVTRSGRQTGSTGERGNLRFRDTVVGDRRQNDMAPLNHRVHIDKFTGGVMNGGLFSTKDVSGKLNFTIGILNRSQPEQTLGLLLFALRDLAAGCFNLGSGYNVGKGFIIVDKIHVMQPSTGKELLLNMEKNALTGDTVLLEDALKSLKGQAA